MKEQQKSNNNNNRILTIDVEKTREKIRVKYRSTAAFSRMIIADGLDVSSSSVFAVLNGNMSYICDIFSVYQGLLRTFKKYGVLVQQRNMKEAA